MFRTFNNVAWDVHFYGWIPAACIYSCEPTASLAGYINAMSAITSADGVIPTIIGEFGGATDGCAEDSNAEAVVHAVLGSGHGFAAWYWNGADCKKPGRLGSDNLLAGPNFDHAPISLTTFGRMVATAIQNGPGPRILANAISRRENGTKRPASAGESESQCHDRWAPVAPPSMASSTVGGGVKPTAIRLLAFTHKAESTGVPSGGRCSSTATMNWSAAHSRVSARACSRCLPASVERSFGAAGTTGASRQIPCRFTMYWTMRPSLIAIRGN